MTIDDQEPGAGQRPTGDQRALSFGAVATAYDAARPTFPAEALDWALSLPSRHHGPGGEAAGSERLQVLDLGAGTGKLAAVAAALGHDVVAVDPSEEMLAVCAKRPGVVTMAGAAESIPLAHASVDAVVVGQAFHWFDQARALPEIARVLRPGGVLTLLWNNYDTVIPWVRRIHHAIMGEDLGGDQFDPVPILLQSGLFPYVETARFRHWHDLDRTGLEQLARSHSRVAVLTESRREAVLDQVHAVYDATARPPEPLRMPYTTTCYRSRSIGS